LPSSALPCHDVEIYPIHFLQLPMGAACMAAITYSSMVRRLPWPIQASMRRQCKSEAVEAVVGERRWHSLRGRLADCKSYATAMAKEWKHANEDDWGAWLLKGVCRASQHHSITTSPTPSARHNQISCYVTDQNRCHVSPESAPRNNFDGRTISLGMGKPSPCFALW
jgi:hypothetical protein